MVRPDNSLPADELYDVALTCGFTVHQVRQCLARLVQEDIFSQEGQGRQALFTATAKGRRQIDPQDEFLRLAWSLDRPNASWDGCWHLVGFTIDEGRRSERNALRDHIVRILSGAPLANGLYVSPHDWDAAIRRVATNLGVADRMIYIPSRNVTVGDQSEPRALAALLWDLKDLADRWSTFVEETTHILDQLEQATDTTQALAAVVAVVARWGVILEDDPLLPPELLPEGWQGATARRLFVEASNQARVLRDEAQIPALFRRFDTVLDEIQTAPVTN